MKISVLILSVLLSGCSCLYHIDKAKKQCPDLFKSDTVRVTDTVRIEAIKADTIFSDTIHDTVRISKERLQIKYIRVGHKVYISGECKADTVYSSRVIRINRPDNAAIAKAYARRWWWWIVVLAAILILIRLLLNKRQ